jgi:hypothetical protein
MKQPLLNFFVLLFVAAGVMPSSGAPFVATDKPTPEIPKSIFVMPNNSNEGRDPFFPDSTRPYETSIAKGADATSLHDLTIGSIMNAGNGRVFAVINNHTFAPGEEGTVRAADGRRISIRCVAIDSKTGAVTVESSGTRAILNFTSRP